MYMGGLTPNENWEKFLMAFPETKLSMFKKDIYLLKVVQNFFAFYTRHCRGPNAGENKNDEDRK